MTTGVHRSNRRCVASWLMTCAQKPKIHVLVHVRLLAIPSSEISAVITRQCLCVCDVAGSCRKELNKKELNSFLSYHEKSGQTIIPNDLSKFFNDVMWMVFLQFRNSHLKYFQDFLNSRHINMSFFLETEKENKLSFLDFEYTCKQGKFTVTFDRKSTFSGTYSNFESFSLLAWSIWFILFIIFSL